MIGTILSAIPALYQMGVGISQQIKGKNMAEDLVDPNYQIPQEYQDILGLAKSTEPQSRQMSDQANLEAQLTEQMAATGGNIQQNATSSTDALAAYVGMNKNYGQNLNQIGSMAARDYEQKMNRYQGMYSNALGLMGQQREKQFQINTLDKFGRDAATASAMQFGGLQNQMGGINGLSSIASSYFTPSANGGLSAAQIDAQRRQ
jgi:hypothetical protein